jgi:hypothetical protein
VTEIPGDSFPDPGDRSYEGFRYQAACLLYFALEILDSHSPTVCVYAERVEDVLIERSDGRFIPVSVKSRSKTVKPFELTDKSFYGPLARFTIHEQRLGDAMESYIWAISNHPLHSAVQTFFAKGINAVPTRSRATLIANVRECAKGFGFNVSEAEIVTTANKTIKHELDSLEAYEALLEKRCRQRIPELGGKPAVVLGQRVKRAIQVAADLAHDGFDILIQAQTPTIADALSQTEAIAKRVDETVLRELLQIGLGSRPSPAEEIVRQFERLEYGELSQACGELGVEVHLMRLADEILRVEPERWYRAIRSMSGLSPGLSAIARTVRRLSMHATSGGTQMLHRWRRDGTPRCVVARSLGYPWFVEELVETAKVELRELLVPVALDRDLDILSDDEQVEYVRAEISDFLRSEGIREIGSIEDTLKHFELFLVLLVAARVDLSELVRRLVYELPHCFVVVQTDAALGPIGTCEVYPVPPATVLRASVDSIEKLQVFERYVP